MRRKSINLVSLILAIALILLIVVLAVYFINKKNVNGGNSSPNETSESSEKTNIHDADFLNSLKTIEEANSEPASNESTTTTPPKAEPVTQADSSSDTYTLSFNNHVYKFKKPVEAKVLSQAKIPEIEIVYPDDHFKFLYNSDSSISFDNLKTTPDLKSHIESKYNVTISDTLKTGNLNNLNIIACTISDNGKPAYLLFTPLKESEIAIVKIYNTENAESTVEDLTKPLDEISSLVSNAE